jgi:hypothetical protein
MYQRGILQRGALIRIYRKSFGPQAPRRGGGGGAFFKKRRKKRGRLSFKQES